MLMEVLMKVNSSTKNNSIDIIRKEISSQAPNLTKAIQEKAAKANTQQSSGKYSLMGTPKDSLSLSQSSMEAYKTKASKAAVDDRAEKAKAIKDEAYDNSNYRSGRVSSEVNLT